MDWGILWEDRGLILIGLVTTTWISALAIVGSTLLGSAMGYLGSGRSFLAQKLAATYTEVLRNIPIIVKIFFLYFILGLPGIWAALVGLIVHQSAYITDVTRAGIRSIASGQFESGLSLGHSRWQVFRYIILPQAVRIVIPPMTSQYVSIIKNSSVVALISVQDLTFETQEINAETFRGFEAATAATVLYVGVALLVISAMTFLEEGADAMRAAADLHTKRQNVQRRKLIAWRVSLLVTLAVIAFYARSFEWEKVLPSSRFLLEAMGRSWLLAGIAIVIGAFGAAPLALARVYGPRGVRHTAIGLIEGVRATPELMIVFWVYFTLPLVTGDEITSWQAAIGSLSVISAAYLAEVIRAGILSVPKGQVEASESAGMSITQTFRYVILPQALRNMLPAIIAQLVSLFKTTSLVYAIGVMEFFRAVTVTNSRVFAPYALYLVMALGYFVSCSAIARIVRWFDPRYQLLE